LQKKKKDVQKRKKGNKKPMVDRNRRTWQWVAHGKDFQGSGERKYG